jgi:2-succinyl-6-hydroxy-2,4-cyclohexadiene-1-carboxylate synthase
MIWPYRSIGNQHNPPIVFLHGFMGSGSDWLPIAERCAGQFFCIMPDLPGHGQNIELPLTRPLTFDSIADGLINLLDQLGLDAVNLAGYSMGGRIALFTALKYPQRVIRLILEGANPGIAGEAERRARVKADDERAAKLLAHGINAFVEQWYQLGLFQTLQAHTQLLAQTKTKRKQNNPLWMAKVISELSPGRQPPVWDRLETLSMPVLLMAGALDSKYAELVKTMARKIPSAAVEIATEAGHNIHLEQPDIFIKLILDFLQST